MTLITEDSQPEVTQPRIVLRAITVIGIALSLFQLYAAGVQPLGLFFQRPIHLGFVLVLCFLIYPAFGRHRKRDALGWAIDGCMIFWPSLRGHGFRSILISSPIRSFRARSTSGWGSSRLLSSLRPRAVPWA